MTHDPENQPAEDQPAESTEASPDVEVNVDNSGESSSDE